MKSLRTIVGGLSLAVFLICNSWAAELPMADPGSAGFSAERLTRIKPVIQVEIDKQQYPGAVMLIARHGRIVYFDSVGRLDPARGTPMRKDALFRLYSMTKPFTSVAIMMLMEEGKLRVSDPVSRFIPALGNLQVSVERRDPETGAIKYVNIATEREVTIQDLLRHTSGLVYGGFTSHPRVRELYAQEKVDWKDVTPAEQITRLAKVPLAHQPGTTFEYGLSTDVLGRIVENISGMPLSQFLQQRVFALLGMKDTAFIVPKDKIDRLAQPFAMDAATNTPINLLDVTVVQANDAGGAGSVGTAADYARFLQMLLNGGELDGVRLLSPTTVRYMTADHLPPGTRRAGAATLPDGTGFGLGFAVRNETGQFNLTGNAGEYFWAGAAGTGFYVDPRDGIICVWMTQAQPGLARRPDRYLFKQMVYQAVEK